MTPQNLEYTSIAVDPNELFDPADWHAFPFHNDSKDRPSTRLFQLNYDGVEVRDEIPVRRKKYKTSRNV